ncbi:MAG: YcjF family protein [Betaproteobacteria bacterium]
MTAQAEIEKSEVADLSAEEQREVKVKKLIKRYAAVSAGLGFIPVPMLDVASISSAQYAMIRDIAEIYGYESTKERTRVIVSSILGGSLPTLLASAGGGSLVKSIPFVGTIAGAVLVPALASAVTIALGRVFSEHFETGGTLLDIDADKLRAHFKAELEAAKLK